MKKYYSLDELQKLPHKWWKKNHYYTPSTKDYSIAGVEELVVFSDIIIDQLLLKQVRALFDNAIYKDITPSIYDYLYAINTELLEYDLACRGNSIDAIKEEAADVAIFAALCLRVHFDMTIQRYLSTMKKHIEALVKNPNKVNEYKIKRVVSTDWCLQQKLCLLVLWGATSGKVIEKIQYNNRRPDHARYSGC